MKKNTKLKRAQKGIRLTSLAGRALEMVKMTSAQSKRSLLSILLIIAFCLPSAYAKSYKVGTTGQGSSGYAMTGAMAKVLLKEENIRIRAMPQGGPVVTLPLVNKGELDFSIAVSFVAGFGHRGEKMFAKLGAQDDLRVVASLRILPLGIMVAEKSKVRSIADFKGRDMPSAWNKQKIQISVFNAMYEMGGITAADVKGFPVPTGDRSVQDLIAGKIEGTIYTMDSGAAQQAHAKIGIRYISLDNTEKNRSILSRHLPGALIDSIQPGDAYPGVDKPVGAIIAPFLLMANKNIDPELVQKMLAVLQKNRDTLITSFAGFISFDPDKMYRDVGIPYHEGALAFYRKVGQVK